ncbi:hypothetical protein E8E15_001271 [Penicillium rubens]|nr:hypothetical protein E8E15_001271 [Penicillium rubens]
MAESTTPEAYMKPATRLRKLLSQPNICIQAPGVYDGLCARLAIEQGFQVMYQGGSMTTAARLGKADLAFASLNDFAQNAQMIANIDPRIPLIADADVGFGSPPNIARMVQICGHLKGKEVVDMETDSLAVEGYQAALGRLLAARECGADMGFLEAIETEEQIKNAVRVLSPMPLMVNLVSNGKTPWFSPEELGEWGVKLAIYPGAAGKSVLHTIRRAYKYLMETGKDDAEAQGLEPKGFFDVMGLQREMEIDKLAGGESFANGA